VRSRVTRDNTKQPGQLMRSVDIKHYHPVVSALNIISNPYFSAAVPLTALGLVVRFIDSSLLKNPSAIVTSPWGF